jgi:hypothetical protein
LRSYRGRLGDRNPPSLGRRAGQGEGERMGRSKEVEAWFARYENPMKEVVLRVRAIRVGS